jgi:molybdate transport system substrate-binding protein
MMIYRYRRENTLKKIILLSTTVLLTTALSTSLTGCTPKEPVELNVSAGVGLTDALKEINSLYMQENPNVIITPNFAAAGILQQQIENGAPADVFIPAAAKQMNALEEGGLILTETRKDLLSNKLVLIVPTDSTLNLTSFTDLTDDKVEKVAMGDPKFVPAGTYGQQALDELGITARIQSKLILCSDVRQVLSYVESGNVDAGIVYSTDAAISSAVKVVASAPDDINAKIVFPVAVIKASQSPDAAKDYEDFLFGSEAKEIFEKYGFIVVSK